MGGPTVFISYSHADTKWKDRLVKQLGVLDQQGLLEVWEDRLIGAGQDWYKEIQKAMAGARVAILLISANFLTSKFILQEEVPKLLQRREQEGMTVVPVLLSDCVWEVVPWLAPMQMRPDPKKWLSSRKERGVAELSEIVREVHSLLRLPPSKGADFPDPGSAINDAVATQSEGDEHDAKRRSELKLKLKKKLKTLSKEVIRDDDEDKPILEYLHETLRCDFPLGQGDIEDRLADFLTEYRTFTLSGLDKAYSRICGKEQKAIASRISEIIDLVTPLQIPQDLWVRIGEQIKQRKAVLERAAPGVVFAEAIAARCDGKPWRVELELQGMKMPNRIGELLKPPDALGAPDGLLHALLMDIYKSAGLDIGGIEEVATMGTETLKARLRGFFGDWASSHDDRLPYVVVKMPEDPDDRARWMRVLEQVKEGLEHLILIELCSDPEAHTFEGRLLKYLHTRRDSERKWKN